MPLWSTPTEAAPLAADVYVAKLDKIELKEATSPEGPRGYWRWTFSITVEGKPEPVSRIGNSAARLTKGFSAWKWAEAINGAPLEPDVPFDLETLFGKNCRVVLSIETGDKGAFNKITDVLPAKP